MNKPNGFTFVELCISVSILAAFLLITTPSIPNSFDRQQTRNFFDKFSTDLYWAESQARSRQALVYVDFFRNLNFYLIRVNGKQEKYVKFPHGYTWKSNFPSDRITFHSDGQIATNGTIEILDRQGSVYRVIFQLSSGRFYIKRGQK